MLVRAVPLASLLPKHSLGAVISLRSSLVKTEAEAPSDVLDISFSSLGSPRAVIIQDPTGPSSNLFPFDGFERPLILGCTDLLKVTLGVSLDCTISRLRGSRWAS